MMSELSNLKVMEILSDATNTIAEGEVLQLMNCNDPDTTEESYMTVIYCKTAKLFEAATRLAAVLTHQPEPVEQAMTDYGKYLGTAFQIIDDVMDYCSQSEEMGKNVGDDLAEGKPTLPLLRHGSGYPGRASTGARCHRAPQRDGSPGAYSGHPGSHRSSRILPPASSGRG
jgi:octaprenyl-diphosphate synthase